MNPINLAVEMYANIVSVALPISLVFHLANRLVSWFTSSATGGEIEF